MCAGCLYKTGYIDNMILSVHKNLLCLRKFLIEYWIIYALTHRGRVTHICVSKVTIIGSDSGLSPGRCQAIIWTNAGILLIRTLGASFNEMLSELIWFSFKKMGLKTSSAKWRQFCLGLNVLTSNVLSKNFKESRCMDFQFSVKTIENKRLLLLQLCRHWWYRKLSIWQLAAPPVTTKLSNWRPSLFNDHENLSGTYEV